MDPAARILVVDDDLEIRMLLAEYLENNGYATASVADGASMRGALQANTFDLIVLDLTMPGEDGLTICRNLRAGSPRHHERARQRDRVRSPGTR